jgi:hypothetical protein
MKNFEWLANKADEYWQRKGEDLSRTRICNIEDNIDN